MAQVKAEDFPRKFLSIAKELEAETATIVRLVEEGERRAEIERQKREEEQRQWELKKAEERRIKALEDSRNELSQIITAWAKAKRIEDFFADAERRAAELNEQDKVIILERMKMARDFAGGANALELLAAQKTPDERLYTR